MTSSIFWKRVGQLAVSAAMVAGAVGCGGSGNDQAASSQAASTRQPNQVATAPKCSPQEDAELERVLTAYVKSDPGRANFANRCIDCSFSVDPTDSYLGKTDSGKDQWRFAVSTGAGASGPGGSDKCYTYYLINTTPSASGSCTIFETPIETAQHDCEG